MDVEFGNDFRKFVATFQVLLRNSTGRAEENHGDIITVIGLLPVI